MISSRDGIPHWPIDGSIALPPNMAGGRCLMNSTASNDVCSKRVRAMGRATAGVHKGALSRRPPTVGSQNLKTDVLHPARRTLVDASRQRYNGNISCCTTRRQRPPPNGNSVASDTVIKSLPPQHTTPNPRPQPPLQHRNTSSDPPAERMFP
jgi:hypothetical protein